MSGTGDASNVEGRILAIDPGTKRTGLALSDELGSLKAEASVERANDPEKKLIRDKAYTHLKEAVDRIRECGRFAFRKNPERAHGYAGEYTRKKNARRKLRDKQNTPPID